MFMHTQNSTRFVSASTPTRRITYTRYMGRNFILTGLILEERQVQLQRWPGVVVTEYRVRPTKKPGLHCFSEHWVNEGDVLGITDVSALKPVCQRCGDHGYISIVGDCDTPCPCCNPVDDEVTF